MNGLPRSQGCVPASPPLKTHTKGLTWGSWAQAALHKGGEKEAASLGLPASSRQQNAGRGEGENYPVGRSRGCPDGWGNRGIDVTLYLFSSS